MAGDIRIGCSGWSYPHWRTVFYPDKMPKSLEITSDFTYIRMQLPPRGLGYGRSALEPWADRINDWSRQRLDVFVYFNNDMEGLAIKDAQTLTSLVTGKVGET